MMATFFLAVIIILFLIIGKYMQNNNSVYKLYRTWKTQYVKGSANSSFVNGSDKSGEKVALSESQGYGMLITMLAAQKIKQRSQILINLLYIIKITR